MESLSTPSPAGEDANDLQKFDLHKFPYHGRAPNLIDKFLIIGYDPKVLEKTLPALVEKKYTEKVNSMKPDTFVIEAKCEERPQVLNEICYDYNKELLDNDMILELLFPDAPTLYLMRPNIEQKGMNIGTRGITFSLSPQDNNNSKKSYNGFGFFFYEPEKFPNMIISLPKIFCILSEYPYFSSYNNLCTKIYQMFKSDISYSLESILYNIVNYVPSPLHYSIDLAIWKIAGLSNEPEIARKQTMPNQLNSSRISRQSSLAPPQNKGINKNDIISFPQLSGYPLFNFNLPVLFNILPVDIIIEVFFFTFLENDIIFYSQNLDVLNLVMYIFSNLNYPCNDSIYFWHILSVSMDSFMNSTSTFVGKTCSTIIGINNAYDSTKKTYLRIKEHFVLDIDNKEFKYVSAENTPEVEKNNRLHDWLLRILKNPASVQGGEIINALKELNKELEVQWKRLNSQNQREKEETNFDLYKYDDTITKHNRNIQKIFYKFVLKIFKKYYNQFKITDEEENKINSSMFSSNNQQIRSQGKNGICVEYNSTDNTTQHDFEVLFDAKFKESSKFGTYVINFMLFYDTIDLFKIPLLFTEEFINRNRFNNSKDVFDDYFDVIDQFYYTDTDEQVLKISLKNNNIKGDNRQFTFNTFYEYFETKLKPNFTRHQNLSNLYEIQKRGAKISLQLKRALLDNKYLLEYIYSLNNLKKDKIDEIFSPMYKELNDNTIKICRQSIIGDIVEQNLISQQSFQKMEIIVFSIFNLIALSREYNDELENPIEEIKILNKIGEVTKFNLRKYMMRIMNIYARLIMKASEQKKEKERATYVECYNMLRQNIQKNGIIPNEEFMALMNSNVINKEEKSTMLKNKGNDNKVEDTTIKTKTNYTFLFEYIGLEDYLQYELIKSRQSIDRTFFGLSDNLQFDREITQPEDPNSNEKSSAKKKIQIKCSILERKDIKPIIIAFYSPRKLFNETNRLINKYNQTMDFSRIDYNHLCKIIWNVEYYIYLIRGYQDNLKAFPFEISQAFAAFFLNILNRKQESISKPSMDKPKEENEDINIRPRDYSMAPIPSNNKP